MDQNEQNLHDEVAMDGELSNDVEESIDDDCLITKHKVSEKSSETIEDSVNIIQVIHKKGLK